VALQVTAAAAAAAAAAVVLQMLLLVLRHMIMLALEAEPLLLRSQRTPVAATALYAAVTETATVA
jgi:hypothetical protein